MTGPAHQAAPGRGTLPGSAAWQVPGPGDPGADWTAGLDSPPSACCCASSPSVTVVFRATTERPYPVEVYLCGRHYRESWQALRDARATVYSWTAFG